MTNQNSKGIIFILIAMALFSIQDALIKFIYNEVALFELYFGRIFIGLILLCGYLILTKKNIVLKTHYPFLTTLRVLLHFFGFSFFFISLTFMSLAMANALFFSSPFFVSILAIIFLKEKMGLRRWFAIFIGFIGVYIVLDPNFNDFKIINLTPIMCALCYAISMIITKITSDKDNVYTQIIHLYIGGLAICILIFILSGKGQFNNFNDPTLQFVFREWFSNVSYSWPFIFIMGVFACIAFYCVFSAYSIASPSLVSLFEYSLIIWSIIMGYFLFKEIPTIQTFLGAILIISAGIYIYIREKVKNQIIASNTPNR